MPCAQAKMIVEGNGTGRRLPLWALIKDHNAMQHCDLANTVYAEMEVLDAPNTEDEAAQETISPHETADEH